MTKKKDGHLPEKSVIGSLGVQNRLAYIMTAVNNADKF
jgi:hypothetical protein